jgi:hypothetical protein
MKGENRIAQESRFLGLRMGRRLSVYESGSNI